MQPAEKLKAACLRYGFTPEETEAILAEVIKNQKKKKVKKQVDGDAPTGTHEDDSESEDDAAVRVIADVEAERVEQKAQEMKDSGSQCTVLLSHLYTVFGLLSCMMECRYCHG